MGADATASRRDEALAWAGAARRARRRIRHELSQGEVGLTQVLEGAVADPLVGSIKLLFVLESLPGARKTDTRRRLAAEGLDPARPLAALGPDERALVEACFGEEATR